MKTESLTFCDARAAEIVKSGEILAFPTETVFGLGIRYDREDAFGKLCALKGRLPDKPFTVMVASAEDIGEFCVLTPQMKRLIDRFMPGEITVLFPVREGLYPWLSLNHPTVGIRISASEEVRKLIAAVGVPMLVTSANLSGSAPLLTAEEVREKFDQKIPGIVSGSCRSLIPSTIVRIEGGTLQLIRQGGIAFEEIEKEWYQ